MRNKHPPNYNRCRFIKAVRFVFEFPPYISSADLEDFNIMNEIDATPL
jgi:hypothetical protein